MAISLYKIGAYGTDDISTLLQFQAQFLSGTDRVSHLRLPFQTSAYQVPAGKTLYIFKFHDAMISVGNSSFYKLGYCDNDVGFDTSTARTNPVMSIGVDDVNNNGLGITPADTNAGNAARNVEQVNNVITMAVSQKFPFIRRVSAVAGGTVLLWGIVL